MLRIKEKGRTRKWRKNAIFEEMEKGANVMNLHEVVKMINTCVDELDFVTARKYMEDNIDMLNGHRRRLDWNAQELLDFVMTSERDTLTQHEFKIIHAINDYASQFNIRSFKSLVKDHVALVSRPDTFTYLNEDSRALLSGMQGTHKES